ncbi:alpha/beta hydrolase [Nocardia sp. NPDC050413]|uniref:alpha/beta fold hydrolase n=1 Tax=Nocardia sp. NPDC050413 TaxID=3155784 RepID=UPI0033C54072
MTPTLDNRIRAIEQRVASAHGLTITEHPLPQRDPRARVLSVGSGSPLIYLNGITAPALGFAPLLAELPGYRHILVEFPGHGLAPSPRWTGHSLREFAVATLTGTLDALGLPKATVIANSLGGLCALWTALDAPDRLSRAVLIGAPATALPGARPIPAMVSLTTPLRGRMEQALMGLPSPRFLAEAALTEALGEQAVATMSDDLVDLHRLPLRRPGRAAAYRSLLTRLLDGRTPRPENILTPTELSRLDIPLLFVWGRDDVILSPTDALPSLEHIPTAYLEDVPGGHNPWFDDPVACATPIHAFVTAGHGAETGPAPHPTP